MILQLGIIPLYPKMEEEKNQSIKKILKWLYLHNHLNYKAVILRNELDFCKDQLIIKDEREIDSPFRSLLFTIWRRHFCGKH